MHAAETFYLAQSATGSGLGTDPSNRLPISWYNNPANWGAGVGKFSDDDTVSIGGIITVPVISQADGSVGHKKHLVWESGSGITIPGTSLSAPGSGLLGLRSYMTCLGPSETNKVVFQVTGNGDGLASSNAIHGIIFSGRSGVEIGNILVTNLYQHTIYVTTPVDLTSVAGLYGNGVGNDIYLHDIALGDIAWAGYIVASVNGTTGLVCSNIYAKNVDHTFSGLGGFTGAVFDRVICADAEKWDTPSPVPNQYHHDGIHFFWGAGVTNVGTTIKNSQFGLGSWGTTNTTMYVFTEGDVISAPGSHTNTIFFLTIDNCLFRETGRMNNGCLNPYGISNRVINCTFLGSTNVASIGMTMTGASAMASNNVFSGFQFPITINTAGAALDFNYYGNYPNAANRLTGTSYNLTSNFGGWKSAIGGEANSQSVTDVKMNSDGSLAAGSVALNGGFNFSALFTDSLNGVARPSFVAWDAGAWQTSTNNPTEPPLVPAGFVTFSGAVNLHTQ